MVQKFGALTKIELMLLKDPLGMYHPLSFAEDDKLRPEEDVTSDKRCKNSFRKQKVCESISPTLQVSKIAKRDKKGHTQKRDTDPRQRRIKYQKDFQRTEGSGLCRLTENNASEDKRKA